MPALDARAETEPPLRAAWPVLRDRVLRAAAPWLPAVALRLSNRLVDEHRVAEAEGVLARALAKFPRHPRLHQRFALAAQCDGRFVEAAERWSVACAVRPRLPVAWAGLAACRRALGDIPAARAAVVQALELAPDAIWIMAEAARIFQLSGEPERSVPLWARVVECEDAPATTWQAYVEALLSLDRAEEADAALQRGFARWPDDNRHLVAASGVLAIRCGDWESAFETWARYSAAFPEDGIGALNHERSARMLQLQRAERQEPPLVFTAPVVVERVEDDDTRRLLLGFESIGQDCEFGSLQRRYGAEPLGLLRWNDVTFPNLAAALEAGFVRLGEPDVTFLDVGPIGEIYVRDRRWNLAMHTFHFTQDASLDNLLPKMGRRLAFLREKFLEDLAAAEKILVFKTDDLSLDQLARLHTLLKTYGPVRLLHVRRAAWSGAQGWPRAGTGEVVALAPDLLVGYLSRIGDLQNMAFDEWVAVCRSASAATASRVPVAAGPA